MPETNDIEELKPGLIIFRCGDVQHNSWYCRLRVLGEDRYKRRIWQHEYGGLIFSILYRIPNPIVPFHPLSRSIFSSAARAEDGASLAAAGYA